MRSSDLTRGLRADHSTLLFGLAPGGVYLASTITGGPVSSYLTFSPLPREINDFEAKLMLEQAENSRRIAWPRKSAISRGGIFSVALSPDDSGPPLAATLSYGVRTFLPPSTCKRGGTGSDRLIHFSPSSLSTA